MKEEKKSTNTKEQVIQKTTRRRKTEIKEIEKENQKLNTENIYNNPQKEEEMIPYNNLNNTTSFPHSFNSNTPLNINNLNNANINYNIPNKNNYNINPTSINNNKNNIKPVQKCLLHYSYIFDNIKNLKLNEEGFKIILNKSLQIDSKEKLDQLTAHKEVLGFTGTVKFQPYNRILFNANTNKTPKYNEFLFWSLLYYYYLFNLSYKVRIKTINDVELEWFNKDIIPEEDEKHFDIFFLKITSNYIPTKYTGTLLQRTIEKHLNNNKSIFITFDSSKADFINSCYAILYDLISGYSFTEFNSSGKRGPKKTSAIS